MILRIYGLLLSLLLPIELCTFSIILFISNSLSNFLSFIFSQSQIFASIKPFNSACHIFLFFRLSENRGSAPVSPRFLIKIFIHISRFLHFIVHRNLPLHRRAIKPSSLLDVIWKFFDWEKKGKKVWNRALSPFSPRLPPPQPPSPPPCSEILSTL